MINQVRPIYVSFTVPAAAAAVDPALHGRRARSQCRRCPPATRGRPGRRDVHRQRWSTPTTGTIRLKATFPNEEGRLWPGQFANVTLTLATEPDAIVVPSAALQSGQQGAYVFVAKPDSTVENRRVTVARTQGNETVIAKGLQAGEKVVTDGQPRLTQGAKIEIRTAGGPGGGERPAGGGRPARPVENGQQGGAASWCRASRRWRTTVRC